MSRSTIFRDYMRRKAEITSENNIKDEIKEDKVMMSVISSLQNFLNGRKTINPNMSNEEKKVIEELQDFFANYGKNRRIVQKAISEREIGER